MLKKILAGVLLATGVLGPSTASAQPREPAVSVRAEPPRASVGRGEQLPIAVVIDVAPHHHIWPGEPVVPPELKGVQAFPTEISVVRAPPGIKVHDRFVQWPSPREVETAAVTGRPIKLLSLVGRSVAYLPVTVAADAPPGRATIELALSYQACDERVCFEPADTPFSVSVEVVGAAPASGAAPDLFKAFDPAVWSRVAAGVAPRAGPAGGGSSQSFDFLGWRFSVERGAYALILLIAFLAGFLLNFTPCVLPVIPLKVLALQQQAKYPSKLALWGAAYCLGIVATFGVLGLLIFGLVTGGQKQDWGQIFSHAWFAIAMAAIVGAMGLGMLGLFAVRLPQSVYAVSPRHDTVHGNFLLGVLTAVLSTPCTGPLLGATLAWAVTQPSWLGLTTLLVMGLGMAAPYAVLIASPRLIDRLPRSGPGGELLKRVMGLGLLAVAAFLARPLLRAEWSAYLVGGLAALASLYLLVGGLRMLRTTRGKAVSTVLALLALSATVWTTALMLRPGPINWRVFAKQPDDSIRAAIRAATDQGRVAVVDFTAWWCTNCHVIEGTILNSEAGRKLLTSPGVVTIKVDLGNAGPDQGWGLVREISGAGGIPLIAVYRRGVERPTYFQSFFKVSDLEAAIQGGPGAASAAP